MIAPFEAALREAVRLLGALAMPVLLAILVAGLGAAILQGVTKIRDRSISVVPRVLAIGLVVSLFGAWFATRLGDFTRQMFHSAESASRAGAPR